MTMMRQSYRSPEGEEDHECVENHAASSRSNNGCCWLNTRSGSSTAVSTAASAVLGRLVELRGKTKAELEEEAERAKIIDTQDGIRKQKNDSSNYRWEKKRRA